MTLETRRVILREWNENDVENLVEGLNNIEVSKSVERQILQENDIAIIDFTGYLENEKWNSTPDLSWRDRYRILDPINGGVMGLKPNFNTWNDATIIKLEEVENG